MIPPGSRYETAERIFTQAHVYNEDGYPYLEGERPNLKIKVVNREATYQQFGTGSIFTERLDYYVKSDEGPQWLGYKLLGDCKRWHEIALFNPAVWYPLDMTMGDYIGIPVQ